MIRTGFQNGVAPDFRILAQDCNYLYLNNYTYYLYLNENSKILEVAPPLLLIGKLKNLRDFYSREIQEYIMYIRVNTRVYYKHGQDIGVDIEVYHKRGSSTS